MKQLRASCNKSDEWHELASDVMAFPVDPPSFIDPFITEKFKGHYIAKTPLWALQHCLTFPYQSMKAYSLELSNASELSTAVDGIYVICGFLNCNHNLDKKVIPKKEHPHDPCNNVKSRNSHQNQIPSVTLYFPSTGTYFSPRFVSDTSRLQSKGLWLRNHGLATKTVFQMLPSTSLHIRISDGMPDPDGQLWKFTDIYHIDVHCTNSPICTLFPLVTGVHVSDEQICIPPDVIIGKIPCELPWPDCMPGESNVLYQKLFMEELLKSKSNRAGCK